VRKIEPWKTVVFVTALCVIFVAVNTLRTYHLYHFPEQNHGVETFPPPSAPVSPPTQQRTSTGPTVKEPESDQWFTHPEQPVAQEADASHKRPEQVPPPRIKTPDELAAEHEAFLAKFLNFRPLRDARANVIALLLVSDSGQLNEALGTAVADRCKPDGVKLLSGLFTQEFVSDGLFAQVVSGSTEVSRSLELTNFVDALLFGRETVQYSTNPDLANTITANLCLELTSFRVTAAGQDAGWKLSANGVGFRQTEALSMAQERLLKQISRTNFDLRRSPRK